MKIQWLIVKKSAENMRTKFTSIKYHNLNAKEKEIFNFQKVAALLADYGFNCIKLADDWQGADFLAYQPKESYTYKVQLKARLTIDKKYAGKDLHIAFRVETKSAWYLVPHGELVSIVGANSSWLESESWTKKGHYSSASPSAKLLTAIRGYAIGYERSEARSQ